MADVFVCFRILSYFSSEGILDVRFCIGMTNQAEVMRLMMEVHRRKIA
jgi:hypothetical protein